MPVSKNVRRNRGSKSGHGTAIAVALGAVALVLVVGLLAMDGELPSQTEPKAQAYASDTPSVAQAPAAPVSTIEDMDVQKADTVSQVELVADVAEKAQLAEPVEPAAPTNALRNGSLDDVNGDGMPVHWNVMARDKVSVEAEGNNRWVLLHDGGMLEQRVALKPEWKALTVSARMKATNLQVGEQAWQCFRIALRFDDKDGKNVAYPSMPELTSDSEWALKEVTIEVPRDSGAASLDVQIALFGPRGLCAADDVSVVPVLDQTEDRLAGIVDPRAPLISDVFLKTSTRRKSVAVEIEIKNIAVAGEVEVSASMLDGKGRPEKNFSSTVRVSAKDVQTLDVEWNWPSPRLWDIGAPNLYTARIEIAGKGLDLSYDQRFGFREIWIEGRRFFLNGTEVRFRPMNLGWGGGHNATADEKAVREHAKRGFNLIEIWPGNGDFSKQNDGIGEVCDRLGMGLTGATPHAGDFRDWQNPDTRKRFQERLEHFTKKARNHPSILMWGSSGNAYQNGRDQAPKLLGRSGWVVDLETEMRDETGLDILRKVKAYDPTRPTFTHAGGYVGDVYTANCYLDFLPLQEREDWLKDWAVNGKMPLLMVEFGTPLYTTYLRGRDAYGKALPTEPLATEWAATYLGTQAFENERPEYREAIKSHFKGGMEYKPWRQGGWDRAFADSAAVVDTHKLFLKNTWRAWRTYGMSGGMIPWEDASGHLDLLTPYNGPSLAWIAGPKDDFTDKAHNFRTGQSVVKSAVLINDYRVSKAYSLKWTIAANGKTVSRGEKAGTLKVAETLFVPISFKTSSSSSKGSVKGAISIEASIGADTHRDVFEYRVIAAARKASHSLRVYDPVGETSTMLKSLGCRISPVEPAHAQQFKGTVVIGRKVLSSMHAMPFDFERFVREGGRALVMAQDRQWLRQGLGLRTAEYIARRVYRVGTAHPIFEGLDDYALSDWAGTSSLMPESSRFDGNDPWFGPMFGFHWGNKGAVSSAPIEKPHRTSWRPLLECEFDLAYSPLMEMEYGSGRVTLCTLDLEDHYENDAAASRIAAELIGYVVEAPIVAKAPSTICVGDDATAKLLESLGVQFKRDGDGAKARALLIADGSTPLKTVEAYARKGARVLVVGLKEPALGAVVTRSASFAGSVNPPVWPECAGLSASDLRWRSTHDCILVTGGEGVDVGADGLLGRRTLGNGVIIYCQVDPRSLPADNKTYFRFTRWRQTRALAQILSNMGATFEQDERQMRLFNEPDHPVYLEGEWLAQLTTPMKEKHPRQGNGDRGISEKAKKLLRADVSGDGWETVYLPAYMESFGEGWKGMDGEAVFKKVVQLPEHFAGRDLVLSVGRVDENEISYFNGVEIGRSSHWLNPRKHDVPGKLVKAGENTITVRTFDSMIHGGMCAQPWRFYLIPKSEPTRFYHDDYRPCYEPSDFSQADDPYRYYRW